MQARDHILTAARGCARISITLDLYSHLMPSLQAASAELFEKALSKMAKAPKCVKSV
jgi:hypothetical protein